ncbi:hypothetical protein YC2023_117177 [Brassica napus]
MGKCAYLGRGSTDVTDLYGSVRTETTRGYTTWPFEMLWECAKSGPRCAKLGRDQNMSWRLCAHLGLSKRSLVVDHQKGIKEIPCEGKQPMRAEMELIGYFGVWTGWLFTRSVLCSPSIQVEEEDFAIVKAMEKDMCEKLLSLACEDSSGEMKRPLLTILNKGELGVSYLMEMARSHERREDSGRSKEEFQEVLVVCNEVMINIASREEAMIQSLCVPYIAGKAQRLTGQSLGLGGFTLFPSSRAKSRRDLEECLGANGQVCILRARQYGCYGPVRVRRDQNMSWRLCAHLGLSKRSLVVDHQKGIKEIPCEGKQPMRAEMELIGYFGVWTGWL